MADRAGRRVRVKKQGNKNSTKVTTGSRAEQAHHRAVMKAAMKVDYESGLLTRGQIVEKYGIWRSTLAKYVGEGDWEYASKREDALTDVHTRMIRKYADSRATISDQHLDELSCLMRGQRLICYLLRPRQLWISSGVKGLHWRCLTSISI